MQEIAIETEVINLIPNERRPSAQDKLYFTSKTQELLESLEQFTMGNTPVALLIGALSSGKTTCLKTLLTKVKSNHELILGFSKPDFYGLVTKYTSIQPMVNTETLTEASLLSVMDHITDDFLLIIDDAEFLPMDTLEILLLAFNKQTTTKCRLLLSGEHILSKRIKTLYEKNNLPLMHSTSNLGPLTDTEAKHYLQKMVFPLIAPFGKHILSKKNIDKIVMLSEGYIGRINRVAMQLAVQKKASKTGSNSKRSLIDILLAGAILVLLAIVSVRIITLVKEQGQSQISKNSVSHLHSAVAVNPLEEEEALPCFIASIENLPEELILPTPSSSKTNTKT